MIHLVENSTIVLNSIQFSLVFAIGCGVAGGSLVIVCCRTAVKNLIKICYIFFRFMNNRNRDFIALLIRGGDIIPMILNSLPCVFLFVLLLFSLWTAWGLIAV